ncbi:substrate-binding domain-containing protein [Carboxylicivirga sp. N1Y90]|uniref:substrate-binding domain-containing protein n=1 Tax=Carboxylicivirga fragile TaxID=3417571 RepID=UPI003D33A431|nr:substrate-binding domain-containing protein [Marinilabiliaceae bacterium N1Y90]
MLKKLSSKNDEYVIVHIDEDNWSACYTKKKEDGFIEALIQKGVSEKNIHILKIKDISSVEKETVRMLEIYPNIKGVFVSTSKVFCIARVIEAHDLNLALIGYDLNQENIEYLKSSLIDFIIYQNPQLEASTAITLLLDHLAFQKKIPRVKNFPIEIIIKENHQEYLTL